MSIAVTNFRKYFLFVGILCCGCYTIRNKMFNVLFHAVKKMFCVSVNSRFFCWYSSEPVLPIDKRNNFKFSIFRHIKMKGRLMILPFLNEFVHKADNIVDEKSLVT